MLTAQVQRQAQGDRSYAHGLCERLHVHLLYWFMYVQQLNMQKGWVKVNIDQQVQRLLNTLSASHITALIALKLLCQSQLNIIMTAQQTESFSSENVWMVQGITT